MSKFEIIRRALNSSDCSSATFLPHELVEIIASYLIYPLVIDPDWQVWLAFQMDRKTTVTIIDRQYCVHASTFGADLAIKTSSSPWVDLFAIGYYTAFGMGYDRAWMGVGPRPEPTEIRRKFMESHPICTHCAVLYDQLIRTDAKVLKDCLF